MQEKLRKLRRVLNFENQQLEAINQELAEQTAKLSEAGQTLDAFENAQMDTFSHPTFSHPIACQSVISNLSNVKHWSILTQQKVSSQKMLIRQIKLRRDGVLGRLTAQRSRVKGLELLEEKFQLSIQSELAAKASVEATDDYLRKYIGDTK